MYNNLALMRVESGTHELAGRDPALIEIGSHELRKIMKEQSQTISGYGRWQFRCLIVGALFYITWHLLEMWALTNLGSG